VIVTYGSHSHPDNQCAVTIDRDVWRDTEGVRIGYTERWTLRGLIFGDGTVADLTTKINTLQAAYAIDKQDLKLLDGATATAHSLLNASCTGGTKVKAVRFPKGEGPEYATYREFEVIIEGSVRSTSGVTSYTESITIEGTGGPEFVIRIPLQGQPIKQVINAATPMRVLQSGRSLSDAGYPTPPSPVLPAAEHVLQRSVTRILPRYYNGSYVDYGVQWSYVMESESPVGILLPANGR
jgi:hypothetical protein